MRREGRDPHLLRRLEAFSDVMFGFAVYSLASNARMPTSPDDLWRSKRSLAIFVVAFAILCALWFRHHRLLRRYFYPDVPGTVLIFAILGTIALYSSPLALYVRFPDGPLALRIFAGGGAIQLSLVAASVAYGLWRRREVWSYLERRHAAGSAAAHALLALALLGFHFIGGRLAGGVTLFLVGAVGLAWIVGRRDRTSTDG